MTYKLPRQGDVIDGRTYVLQRSSDVNDGRTYDLPSSSDVIDGRTYGLPNPDGGRIKCVGDSWRNFSIYYYEMDLMCKKMKVK